MRFKEMNEKIRKYMKHEKGQFNELNAMIVEGPSGIGKSSAMYQTIIEEMSGIVKKEGKVKTASEIRKEAERRVIFISMGTMDDVIAMFGMAAAVNGKLEFLRPEKYQILWEEPETPKIIMIDELNRVDDIKMMNAIQVFLDRGDRKRNGIHNTVVFGTQNPSDDINYSGTEEADLALEYRIVKYVLNIGKEDLDYIAEFRNWRPEVVDAVNFLYEDQKQKNIFAPRLLETASDLIKQGLTDVEDLRAGVKDSQLGDTIFRACNGTLFKVLSLSELKELTPSSDVGVAQLLASFRTIFNETIPKVSKDPEAKKVIEDLGHVMCNIPAHAMAAIHTRHASNQAVLKVWAKNKDLNERVRKITAGEL